MLSNEDHPGLFTFLIGMIVVVLAAVGLSLLVDVKFSVSRSPKSLQKEIETGAEELERLTDHHRELARRLAQGEEHAQTALQTRTSLRSEFAEQAQRLAALTESRDQLQQAIPLTEQEFERYRAEYRKQTWDRAAGQALGTLKVRGGREYRQAVIKRVTEVGLEIEFEGGGKARIQAPDLDPAVQDRFQWNDEERRQRLKEERDQQRAVAGPEPPKPAPKPTVKPVTPLPQPVAPPVSPASEQLKQLRSAVELARSKVDRLTTQLREARTAAARGENSVPGSLKTWVSRIAELEALLNAANQELAVARSNLAVVAPTSPPP